MGGGKVSKKQIFVATDTELFPIGEIGVDVPIEQLKLLVAQQLGVRAEELVLQINGSEIRNGRQTLGSLGVQEKDIVVLSRATNSAPLHSTQNINPNVNETSLTASTLSNFETNEEYQRRAWEQIRLQNVEKNMSDALEYSPESFGSVVMLYIPCEINGTSLKAFVDSGAQTTIMSVQCADKCGILRLLDRRFSGYAKGVGMARILGRVHLVTLRIGNLYLDCSVTIIDQPDMDFLLGLDMLRRFQASIDLKHNCLRIGDEQVPFLAEKDLYEEAPLFISHSPSVPRNGLNSTSNAHHGVSEESIRNLSNLGFSRHEALKALEMAAGDEQVAAGLLFGQ